MAKLILSIALLAALVGTIQSQGQSASYQSNGQIPPMQQIPNMNQGLLGGLMGGGNNGGLMDMVSNLPRRGMDMVNNLLSNIRNMLPGLGRNGTNNLLGPMNQQMPFNNQNQNGLLPNLNNLANPVRDLLQPNGNSNSPLQGLTNTLNGLTRPNNV